MPMNPFSWLMLANSAPGAMPGYLGPGDLPPLGPGGSGITPDFSRSPEAFGRSGQTFYDTPSGPQLQGPPSDDTAFLDTLAANRGPESFGGSSTDFIPGEAPGTAEPIVQVPTSYNPSFPSPEMPGPPAASGAMPSNPSAPPQAEPLPDWLLNALGNKSGHEVRRAEPLPDWLLSAVATPGASRQNPIGAFGVGGEGGSFFGGRGSLDTPGGVPLGLMGDPGGFLPSWASAGDRGAPLSQEGFNWFLYPPGIKKPSFDSYISSFPRVVSAAGGRTAGGKAGVKGQ